MNVKRDETKSKNKCEKSQQITKRTNKLKEKQWNGAHYFQSTTQVSGVTRKVSNMKEAAAATATTALTHHWQSEKAFVCKYVKWVAIAASLTKIFGSTHCSKAYNRTTATKYMHRPTTMHIIVMSRCICTALLQKRRPNTRKRAAFSSHIFDRGVCRASRAC